MAPMVPVQNRTVVEEEGQSEVCEVCESGEKEWVNFWCDQSTREHPDLECVCPCVCTYSTTCFTSTTSRPSKYIAGQVSWSHRHLQTIYSQLIVNKVCSILFSQNIQDRLHHVVVILLLLPLFIDDNNTPRLITVLYCNCFHPTASIHRECFPLCGAAPPSY